MSKKAAVQKEVARRLFKKGDAIRVVDDIMAHGVFAPTGYVCEDESSDRTTGLVHIIWWRKNGSQREIRLWSTLQLLSETTSASVGLVDDLAHMLTGVDLASDESWSVRTICEQNEQGQFAVKASNSEELERRTQPVWVVPPAADAVTTLVETSTPVAILEGNLTASYAAPDRPLTASLVQRGIQLPEASDMIKVHGNKHLGHRMCEYSDGMEDAIYKVGALFFRGQSVSLPLAYTAYSALHAFYKHNHTPHARRVLTDLIACIKAADLLSTLTSPPAAD